MSPESATSVVRHSRTVRLHNSFRKPRLLDRFMNGSVSFGDMDGKADERLPEAEMRGFEATSYFR